MAMVGLMLIALGLGLMRPATDTPSTLPDADRFDEPEGRRLQRPGETITAKRQAIPTGLARAYAMVGALADGNREQQPPLDEDAARYVDQARRLLAAQSSNQTGGASAAVDGPGVSASPAERTGASGSALSVVRDGDPVPATPHRDGAVIVADASALPREFSTGDDRRQRQQITGDLDKVLVAPDAWVAIPYKPGLAQGVPLTIRNRSGAGYAVSLHGRDFGSVRVNGGLVVPGRFYQVRDIVEITSEVPVNIHVRPLSVVGDYYDSPAVPSANG